MKYTLFVMRSLARVYRPVLYFGLVCVAVLAVAHILAVLFIFSQRAAYPFDLEWVENQIFECVSRVMRGAPVYAPASVDFTGDIYTPLFYFVSAPFAALFGEGLPALRLVSILATLGSFGLIGLLVWRGSGSRVMALIAAGCFAATYEPSGVTFDLARTDSLSLAWMLGVAFVAWTGRTRRAAVLAGALVALTWMTKQSHLVALPLVLLAGFGEQWRLRVMAIASAAVSSLIAALFLQVYSAGQAWPYILTLTSQQPFFLDRIPQFLSRELLNVLPALCVMALAGAGWFARKKDWFWLALLAGGVMTSLLPRIKVGGSINTLMPAYAVIVIVAGVTLGRLIHAVQSSIGKSERMRYARAGLCVLAVAACGYQLVRLRYDPTRHIPTASDFAQRQRMVEDIRQINGEVWIPAHSVLARLAGKRAYTQSSVSLQFNVNDTGLAEQQLLEQERAAVEQGRFAAILIDPRRDLFIREWINPDTYRFEEKSATPPRPEQSTLPTWWYYKR